MPAKIMIVDDDPNIREMYKATLEAQGYEVVAEPNGEKALDVMISEKPDLVLLDIMMPQIHGLHILDIIKATPDAKDIKVVMLTALSDDETQKEAKKFGATDFIVKSETTMPEVLKRIDKALSR
jgi:DNA-binding response OmpR family regulator